MKVLLGLNFYITIQAIIMICVVKFSGPLKRNNLIGYRSKRALRSEEAFAKANEYFSPIFVYGYLYILALQWIIILFDELLFAILWHTLAILILIPIIYFSTERELKKNRF